jgi:hypothetical protein
MDFEFFKKLSSKEAKAYLENFINEARRGFNTMHPQILADGLRIDFTIVSLLPFFTWTIRQLKTFPEKEDENLPFWIRQTDSYKKGLYSFDEMSNVLILRFAYYMGECFNRTYNNLKWSIGKSNTMQPNMPVVTGFRNNMELAVLLVSKNMFMKVIEDDDFNNEKTAIQRWTTFV